MQIARILTRTALFCAALLVGVASVPAQSMFGSPVSNPGVNAQKAGSVLVFPYYNSDPSGDFAKSDTLITITNVTNGPATVNGAPNYHILHLFFISGSNCAPADTFVCLTPNGSLQILASGYDPMVRGYLVAIALDADGAPTQNNSFIGSAYVRDATIGIIDGYSAEAFQKFTNNPVALDTDGSAILQFDGLEYEQAPSQFAVQIQDPAVSDQTMILASVSGDLGSGLAPTGQQNVGVLYRADERPASFQPKFTGCMVIADIANTNFRIVPGPLSAFLKDSYGYLKFNVNAPAVGLLFSRQAAVNAGRNRFSGIRPLHVTGLGSSTLRMPMFSPYCGF